MKFTDHFVRLSFPNLGLVRFPSIEISREDRATLDLKTTDSNRMVLKRLCWSGYLSLEAKGKFVGITREQVIARFKIEHQTFDSCSVHDYLLMIWDINRWCDQQGIVRGYGRGSSGSSLSLYCLGVTRMNPMRHKGVDFFRFMSEARLQPVVRDGVTFVNGKSAPDIDCDYQYLRRADVVRYIENKYAGRTTKISTRLDLTGKMALKDTLKVYAGYQDEDAKRVSDMIEVKYGKVQSLNDARENEDIKKWLAESPFHIECYDLAVSIEGLGIARGQHPSGVGISYDPIDGNIPVELSKTKEVVSSYDMDTVAGLLIKIDALGLRTLDQVAETSRLVGIKADDIDIDDPSIYSSLPVHSNYLGLFQIADGLTKEFTHRIGPRNVDELAAILALSRPGALSYASAFQEYIKSGTIKPFYPPIDDILKSTGGALIMQEQITEVCRDVFGLSGIDADSVRYACGKKLKKEMAVWEPVLFKNGRERGIPDAVIQAFWETCNASADYSFNFSHSLLYAYLTAATVFLKAHYPLQFYLVMLKLAREEPNPIEYMNEIIAEMKSAGFTVLPPDIVKSESDFIIDGAAVRFGLSSIKGISEATMAKLSSFKRSFANQFEVFEAASAAKVPINVLTSLIYSGCIDTKGRPRSLVSLYAQLYNLLTDREKPIVHRLSSEYNEDLLAILKALPERKDEKGKPLIRVTRLETLRRDYADYYEMYLANSANEELCCYLMERSLLGFSYTSTLHKVYSSKVVGLTEIATLKKVENAGKPFKVVAFIGDDAKVHTSKAGIPYWRGSLVDESGAVRTMLHNVKKLDECKAFNGRLPTDGDIAIVSGQLSKDGTLLFAESILVQPQQVQLKKVNHDHV